MTVSNTGKLSNSQIAAAQNNTATGGTSIANNFDQFLTLLTTQLRNQNAARSARHQSVHPAAGAVRRRRAAAQAERDADGAARRQQGDHGRERDRLRRADRHGRRRCDAAQGRQGRMEAQQFQGQGTGTITIKDTKGNVVFTETKALTAGDQTYSWDGKTSTGSTAPEGEYVITVDGKDVSGAAITVKTEITGKVDGIDFSTAVPTLLIGSLKVSLDKVKSVKSTP
jgi:flagellar basal-body rod modification protein FlgD